MSESRCCGVLGASERSASLLGHFCSVVGRYFRDGLASGQAEEDVVETWLSHGDGRGMQTSGVECSYRANDVVCAVVERHLDRCSDEVRGMSSEGAQRSDC